MLLIIIQEKKDKNEEISSDEIISKSVLYIEKISDF